MLLFRSVLERLVRFGFDIISLEVNTLKETTKAYIAGFLDGEGCITFSIGKRNKSCYADNGRLKCPKDMFYLLPSIQITNTSLRTLQFMKNEIGFGKVFMRLKKKKLSDRKIYKLTFFKQKDILKILESLLPYLILKRKQAILMIEYCKHRLREGKGRNHNYSERDREIASLVQNLNQTH